MALLSRSQEREEKRRMSRENTGEWLLEVITGKYADDYNYMGGEDYSDEDYQGLGVNDELYSDGFYDAEGNFIPYDDAASA